MKGKHMQEVTITEAAKCLGVSMDTVRRRIGKGELKARKVPSPHGETYLVELPDDTPPGPEAPPDKVESKPEVEAMRKTISILETELEARRREVQELHVLLQQFQRQLPPGKTENTAAGSAVKVLWWRRLIPWGKH
jgi:excisionase family DNA binding protein